MTYPVKDRSEDSKDSDWLNLDSPLDIEKVKRRKAQVRPAPPGPQSCVRLVSFPCHFKKLNPNVYSITRNSLPKGLTNEDLQRIMYIVDLLYLGDQPLLREGYPLFAQGDPV